jgi:bile acid:Na+ symporter, BASS family
MIHLLGNRNFIFMLSIVLGLALPQLAGWTEPLTLPVLALIMMLATLNVPGNIFRNPRSLIIPLLAGITMSYLIQGGVTLALSALLIRQENLRIGFVLVAAVPPAIAVIPFTGILEGNVPYSHVATIGSYLAALLIVPLMFLLLPQTVLGETWNIIMIMLLLIGFPLIVSRIIIRLGFHTRVAACRGLLIDWGFFIVLYTIIGLNRDLILREPSMIAPVAVIIFAGTFILGFLIEKAGNLLQVDRKTIISLVLLGTMKNQGIAGGLALSLFSREAALPAAVSTIIMIVFFIWLDIRRSWKRIASP